MAAALAASPFSAIGAMATIIISMTARTANIPFVLLDIAFIVSFSSGFQAPATEFMRSL